MDFNSTRESFVAFSMADAPDIQFSLSVPRSDAEVVHQVSYFIIINSCSLGTSLILTYLFRDSNPPCDSPPMLVEYGEKLKSDAFVPSIT